MKRKLIGKIIILSCLYYCVLGGFGQEDEKNFDALMENALEILIETRIYQTGGAPSQMNLVTLDSSRMTTIPGQSVSIQYKAKTLVIKAVLTIYKDINNSWFLVVQSHVWLSEPENVIKYYSCIRSLPIQLNETIVFYPLGISNDQKDANVYNIELVIEIIPIKIKKEDNSKDIKNPEPLPKN